MVNPIKRLKNGKILRCVSGLISRKLSACCTGTGTGTGTGTASTGTGTGTHAVCFCPNLINTMIVPNTSTVTVSGIVSSITHLPGFDATCDGENGTYEDTPVCVAGGGVDFMPNIGGVGTVEAGFICQTPAPPAPPLPGKITVIFGTGDPTHAQEYHGTVPASGGVYNLIGSFVCTLVGAGISCDAPPTVTLVNT